MFTENVNNIYFVAHRLLFMFSGRLAETNIVAEAEGTAIRERFCRDFPSPDGIAAAAMRGGSARNTAESQEIGPECVRTGLRRLDENLSIRCRSRSEGRFVANRAIHTKTGRCGQAEADPAGLTQRHLGWQKKKPAYSGRWRIRTHGFHGRRSGHRHR